MSRKTRRIEDAIKREISAIIQRDVKDPRISFVTVMSVRVSDDLSIARVYLSIMDGDKKEIFKAVDKAAGFIRTKISQRMAMKRAPELKFFLDTSLEYSSRMESLFQQIRNEKKE